MNENEARRLFTKENVQQIQVPDVVVQDLVSIIDEKMRKSGIYFRIAHRVKAVDSMVDKMNDKLYGVNGGEYEFRKLQDLVGIRIILYYSDDLSICRNLLDTLFSEPGEWETTDTNEYEFKAMKTNGVFKMPSYLSKSIVNPVLSDFVDDTFEVQIRTNAFEGWHEIEHDMRYKGTAFDMGSERLARKMNSILATFELCDDSIVGLMEDLGHEHYKNHHWDDMLRCHYRLTFTSDPLSQEIWDAFDSDSDLAKIFYKFPRGNAIEQLWNDTTDNGVEHTLDNIVRIVNAIGPKDERLNQAFAMIDKRVAERKVARARKKFEPFKKLGRYKVFQAHTWLNTANLGQEEAYRKASSYIWSWVHSRFSEVFDDLPEEISSYYGILPGYRVEVTYKPQELYFREETSHLDSKIANRLWISQATLEASQTGICFTVTNEYVEPEEYYRDPENILFSRPNFFGEIADNIGIVDGERMKESLREIDAEGYDELKGLISLQTRQFPVVVFIGNDKQWVDDFDVEYFSYLVGYYAHVKKITDEETAVKFAHDYDLDANQFKDSITVFYPGQNPKTSYRKDILETTFEVIKLEKRKYWNETGCRAYRRQLVSEIREQNVKDQTTEQRGIKL